MSPGSHDATIDLIEAGDVDTSAVTEVFRTPAHYDYHRLLRPDVDEQVCPIKGHERMNLLYCRETAGRGSQWKRSNRATCDRPSEWSSNGPDRGGRRRFRGVTTSTAVGGQGGIPRGATLNVIHTYKPSSTASLETISSAEEADRVLCPQEISRSAGGPSGRRARRRGGRGPCHRKRQHGTDSCREVKRGGHARGQLSRPWRLQEPDAGVSQPAVRSSRGMSSSHHPVRG